MLLEFSLLDNSNSLNNCNSLEIFIIVIIIYNNDFLNMEVE